MVTERCFKIPSEKPLHIHGAVAYTFLWRLHFFSPDMMLKKIFKCRIWLKMQAVWRDDLQFLSITVYHILCWCKFAYLNQCMAITGGIHPNFLVPICVLVFCGVIYHLADVPSASGKAASLRWSNSCIWSTLYQNSWVHPGQVIFCAVRLPEKRSSYFGFLWCLSFLQCLEL